MTTKKFVLTLIAYALVILAGAIGFCQSLFMLGLTMEMGWLTLGISFVAATYCLVTKNDEGVVPVEKLIDLLKI